MQWPNWLLAQANASASITSISSVVDSGNKGFPRLESLGAAGAQLPDDLLALALSFLSLKDLCRSCIPAGRALAQAVVFASTTTLQLYPSHTLNHNNPALSAGSIHHSASDNDCRNRLQWSSALLAEPPPNGGYRSMLNHWLQGIFTSAPRTQGVCI